MEKYYHSVRLDKDKCVGCTNCIKNCPTEAIRVRGGKARIINDRCIDCGECVRVCPHFAKIAVTDVMSSIRAFKYKVALPAPSLYGQFKSLQTVANITGALKAIGFDDVYDVARGADIITHATKRFIAEKRYRELPVISSACPAIVRLIQVRFPALLDNVLPLISPMEVAAQQARATFCKRNCVPPKQVGVFFISPCAAKMTAIHNPLGHAASEIDGCLSMTEVYGMLSMHFTMNKGVSENGDSLPNMPTPFGIGWGAAGGEAAALGADNYLAVDGIQNVIQVLEEIEKDKLSDLVFFEGLGCVGGCVGGPLNFENKFVAKNRMRQITERMQPVSECPDDIVQASMQDCIEFTQELEPLPVMQLDSNLAKAIEKMESMDKIYQELPELDCGSCGAPTCLALAEDIVRGDAEELDCIFKLRDKLRHLSRELANLADADNFDHIKDSKKEK